MSRSCGFCSATRKATHSEEQRLAGLFKQDYEAYHRRTPAFFPSFSLLAEPEHYMVNPRVFKRNLFDALWFVWLLGIIEIVEALHESGILPVFIIIY